MTDLKGLGKLLKAHREKSGLSQQDIGNRMDVTQSYISAWELGKPKRATFEQLRKLAHAYKIDIDVLSRTAGYALPVDDPKLRPASDAPPVPVPAAPLGECRGPQYLYVKAAEDTHARGIWVNMAHVMYVTDLHSGPDVILHMVDGTTLRVGDVNGGDIQDYCERRSLKLFSEDET
jgi:transcriptional regulator with XRE-family HTH domain